MTIAPLAALGLVNTAISVIRSVAASAGPKNLSQASAAPSASLWHELAARIDVRRASAPQLAQAAQALCDAGLITVEQCAALQLQPAAAPGPMRTAADASGRVDWIAEFTARLEHAQSQGNSLLAGRMEAALGVLQRLAAGRQGPLRVVA